VDRYCTDAVGLYDEVRHLLQDAIPVQVALGGVYLFQVTFELGPGIRRDEIEMDGAVDPGIDTRRRRANQHFAIDASFLTVDPVYPDIDILVGPV